MVRRVIKLSKYVPVKVKAFCAACTCLKYQVEVYYAEVLQRRHIGYFVVLVPSKLPAFLLDVASILHVIVMLDPRTGFADEQINVEYRIERFICSLPDSL